jgi:hypothetical protein
VDVSGFPGGEAAMSKSTTKAKKLKAVANPKVAIQDLCGLISLMHRSQQFDLSDVLTRKMDLMRRIIVTNGIDFANEIAAPFNVTFRSDGPIATAKGYKMVFKDVRDVSGRLE